MTVLLSIQPGVSPASAKASALSNISNQAPQINPANNADPGADTFVGRGKSQNPIRFQGKSNAKTQPTALQNLLSYWSGPQPPQSPYRIRADESIPDGTVVASGFNCNHALLNHATVSPQHISPISQNLMTGMLVDLRQDKRLRDYFTSSAFRQLQQAVPSAQASVQAEEEFLHALNRNTNQQFDWGGLSLEDQLHLSNQDSHWAHRDKMDAYISNGGQGKLPVYHRTRLLGKSMSRGVGVCRQRALLNALTVRKIGRPGLKASYQSGFYKDPLDQGDFSSQMLHSWNTVTMPSGRKYLLDPLHEVVQPVTRVQGYKAPLNYASFEHVFKHGNPNLRQFDF